MASCKRPEHSFSIIISLSSDWCAFFFFQLLQTMFFWLCMSRHRGRIGNPLSKKKSKISKYSQATSSAMVSNQNLIQLMMDLDSSSVS